MHSVSTSLCRDAEWMKLTQFIAKVNAKQTGEISYLQIYDKNASSSSVFHSFVLALTWVEFPTLFILMR